MKDLLCLLFSVVLLSSSLHHRPDIWDLGNCDNNIIADPLSTPLHIVPEWYFLLWFGFIKSFPMMILGLCILLLFLSSILLLGIRNLSSISYSVTNLDHGHLSTTGLIIHCWFRAYWTLGLSLLFILSLFPLSSLSITPHSLKHSKTFHFCSFNSL